MTSGAKTLFKTAGTLDAGTLCYGMLWYAMACYGYGTWTLRGDLSKSEGRGHPHPSQHVFFARFQYVSMFEVKFRHWSLPCEVRALEKRDDAAKVLQIARDIKDPFFHNGIKGCRNIKTSKCQEQIDAFQPYLPIAVSLQKCLWTE